MIKVLILCSDYPPLNSVGAQRPVSWARHFPEKGIHPVVISRSWPENVSHLRDKFRTSGLSDEIIETTEYTHISCRPKSTPRGRHIEAHGLGRKSLRRKILTVINLLFSNFSFRYDELEGIYLQSRKYLQSNKVSAIIATGEPFVLFRYGCLLSKEFKTPWIADYRDLWIGNHTRKFRGSFSAIIEKYNGNFQKKWISNCALITTVSDSLAIELKSQTGKPCLVVRNGFDEKLITANTGKKSDYFELLYVGTIYDSVYIDILEAGLKGFFEKNNPKKTEFRMTFVGIDLNYTKGTERIYRLCETYPEFSAILKPMIPEKAIEIESRATVLLNLVPGSISGGITPVKLYEYLALEKPILNIETEQIGEKNDFVPYIFTCHSAEETTQTLDKMFREWKKGEIKFTPMPAESIQRYSRRNQANILAEEILNLIQS